MFCQRGSIFEDGSSSIYFLYCNATYIFCLGLVILMIFTITRWMNINGENGYNEHFCLNHSLQYVFDENILGFPELLNMKYSCCNYCKQNWDVGIYSALHVNDNKSHRHDYQNVQSVCPYNMILNTTSCERSCYGFRDLTSR